MAKYTYDAWGNLLSVTNASGTAITSSTHIANRNPLRYRGYYFDSETGFYYLQSRYYDPANRRFINADGYASTGQGFIGYNTFAYCLNNPIVFFDAIGERPVRTIRSRQLFDDSNEEEEYIDPNTVPNPESGYVPPKKNPNPKKVRNPNGRGYGWPAQDGGVWVPDNKMDGGPGWVVQYPGGRHEHRYPDGHVRRHEISGDMFLDAGADILKACATIGLFTAAATLVLDNATGVGAADDQYIPGIIEIIKEMWGHPQC